MPENFPAGQIFGKTDTFFGVCIVNQSKGLSFHHRGIYCSWARIEDIKTIYLEDHFLISKKRPLFRNAVTHYVKTSSAEVCDVAWSVCRYTPLSSTASYEQINYQVLEQRIVVLVTKAVINFKIIKEVYSFLPAAEICAGLAGIFCRYSWQQ